METLPAKNAVKSRFLPTPSGALAVIGLIVFGLIILGGLYLTPHAKSPAAPAGVPLGVPERKLRFVAYDLARQHPSNDPLFAQISQLDADYVLLQGVDEDDAPEIVESLKLQQSFHPQLYQRSERLSGRKGTWGNLILSRQTLYEGAPLGGVRGGFGGQAVSIVDGHEFMIADLHLSPGEKGVAESAEFKKLWDDRKSPPLVIAVLASDPDPPDGFDFLIRAPGDSGERFFVSKDWKIVATGTVPNAGSGLAPRWIDVIGKSSHPLTAPLANPEMKSF